MSVVTRLLPKLNQKPDLELLPVFPSGCAVPRVLHQCYGRAVPPSIEQTIERTLAINPRWEHRLYDDQGMAAFIEGAYGRRILDYYQRINPKYGAARADLFRYLLLYKCGGIYLDIKSAAEKPLDEVLRPDDVYLLSGWRTSEKDDQFEGLGSHTELAHIGGEEFQQWHIVAAPGHPFLKAVIENVLRNIDCYNPGLHGTGKIGVLRLTGPIAYTLAIHPLLHAHKHRIVESHGDLGFNYNIFSLSASDTYAHAVLFKTHYSMLTEPVVSIDWTTAVLSLFIRAARKARRVAHLTK